MYPANTKVSVLEKSQLRGMRRHGDNSKLDLGKSCCEDVQYFYVTSSHITTKYFSSSQPNFPRSSLLFSSFSVLQLTLFQETDKQKF